MKVVQTKHGNIDIVRVSHISSPSVHIRAETREGDMKFVASIFKNEIYRTDYFTSENYTKGMVQTAEGYIKRPFEELWEIADTDVVGDER